MAEEHLAQKRPRMSRDWYAVPPPRERRPPCPRLSAFRPRPPPKIPPPRPPPPPPPHLAEAQPRTARPAARRRLDRWGRVPGSRRRPGRDRPPSVRRGRRDRRTTPAEIRRRARRARMSA